MSKKIKNLPRKLHSKLGYRRFDRETKPLQNPAPKNLRPAINLPDLIYWASPEAPNDEFSQILELIEEQLPCRNRILFYRILKDEYGPPDSLGVWLDEKNNRHVPADWGYTFELNENILAEIRSIQFNTDIRLRLWSDKNGPRDGDNREWLEFFKCLEKHIEKNIHFFNELNENDGIANNFKAIQNQFAEKYYSAERVLQLAVREDEQGQASKKFRFGEDVPPNTRGALYLCASILFFVAFEALINLILECPSSNVLGQPAV